MRKLLFVPSVVLLGLAAGCTSQMVDSRGNPVFTPNGDPVMVSSSTQEKVDKAAHSVSAAVQAIVDRESSAGKLSSASTTLPEGKIKGLLGPEASEDDVAAVKAFAEAEALRYKKEVVYPARVAMAKKALAAAVDGFLTQGQYKESTAYLNGYKKTGIAEIDGPVSAFMDELNKTRIVPAYVKSMTSRVTPFVEKSVAGGKYDLAREALWRAPTTGNAEVDAELRKFAIEKMRVLVNPTHWAVIEKEIMEKVAAFAAEKQFNEAIAWLKAYKHVRTYSLKLDEKLKTVEAELVKIGVKEANMKPILAATGKLVGEAEKIVDMTDVTTNAVTTTEGKEIAGFSPDLKAYEERLEEYRKLLVRYDCTEEAAKGIVGKFDGEVKPLLAPLSKAASKENGSTSSKAFLQLGTGALNARIDKLAAAQSAKMREAYILFVIDELTAKVKKLVADGEFAEAREAIWVAASTKDLELGARVRKAGCELLLGLVNPLNWTAIEKEFADKVKEAKDGASYDDAIAWAEAYPPIRTYSEVIDKKLDGVKDELEKMGVPAEKIEAVVKETQKATVEVERLASHVDTVTKKVVGEVAKPELANYKKLLDGYRAALVRNDCTKENADKLVADFDKKASALIALLSGKAQEKEVLLLGSNAVNDRLAKLRAKTVETLKSMKYKYVFTDLIAKVSEAVAEGRYADARNVVRDVALVKDTDWDARIFATRVGLLNSVVNPNQCAALLKEIDAKAKELFDAKKYEEFREYAEKYEYVHDTYQQILDALDQLKAAMVGLTIAQGDAETYLAKLSARIREMLEKRTGSYSAETDKDLSELEKALAELEKGIVAQYYRPADVAKFCQTVKAEILALITKAPDPMTTWELNEALRVRLNKYVAQLDGLIKERDAANEAERYAKLLADIDGEVSFDSQIAMAEDAIAKQLGVKCPEAHLRLNALLGEYARTMRLLKLGKKIDAEQATVVLLGGVYLDQAAVVTRALKLGADVNGTSARDPLARTGVLLAIQTGHNSFLKQLADEKAALDPVDANGDTALHYAVRRGNLAVVKAMLAKNGVDKANKAGETALFIAVRRNQASVAAALVAAKADVAAKNAKGQTPMDAACLAGSRDVLDVLADAGAEYGPVQLTIAAAKDRLAVAQWLVGKGVDVNAPGVMHATVGKSDTYRYLLHEGGVFKPCGNAECRRCQAEQACK